MAVKEKAIENEIMNFLRAIGIFCWKNDSVGIFDPVKKVYRSNQNQNRIKGVSDILGIIDGKFVAIEVKSETGKLRPEQKVFIQEIVSNGGVAFVARSLKEAAQTLAMHFPDHARLKHMVRNYFPRD